MTIQDGAQFRQQSFVGDGATTSFNLSQVKFADADDVLVFVDTVQQTAGVDYSVSGDGLALTAVLAFIEPPANLADVRAERNSQPRQNGDFGSQSSFKPEQVSLALDDLARQVHDLRLYILSGKVDLPADGAVPDTALVFDDAGNPTTKPIVEFGGWSAVTAVVVDGERRVYQIVDWTGGAGPKPAVGLYLGATGFVADIANGTDVRGPGVVDAASVAAAGALMDSELADLVAVKAINQGLTTIGTPTFGSMTLSGGVGIPLVTKARAADNLGIRVLESSNSAAGIQFTDDPVTVEYGSISVSSTVLRINRAGANPLYLSNNGADRLAIQTNGNIDAVNNSVLGYGAGSGSLVFQATSRTTGVTMNTAAGTVVLFSAAGSTAWTSFIVTNSRVSLGDTVIVSQRSGQVDKYLIHVTAVSAGSFEITFATTGGTTVEQPRFNFAIIGGSTS